MAVLLDDLIAQVIALEIRLRACTERLVARTDDEALHDLRVATRRLRSLLHPLRGLAAVDVLDQAAVDLTRLSSPLRDLEVLIIELRSHRLERLVPGRERALRSGYAQFLLAPELTRLLQVLEAWPHLMRVCDREGLVTGLRQKSVKFLGKSRRQVEQALRDPAHDRHRLRLLIKRLRYGLDAYPDRVELSPRTRQLLVGAQTALGNWHDHVQWLARAENEPDLRPRVRAWQVAMHAAEVRSDRVLEKLLRRLG
ncbi:CHAD domain-containing protein [Pseudomonas resinovorans]|uniref:CHAD domain-containing protein n=1 Tax=Metapseudomonas resinovorans TaxID=53412 RepID=A0ABT4YAB2_METRE|nr:CHAD domain-containing protein [Pseudomonas resinovorans]MDA8485821.1 CHAD domain-containing protein [Pseudomonas resinovorans]